MVLKQLADVITRSLSITNLRKFKKNYFWILDSAPEDRATLDVCTDQGARGQRAAQRVLAAVSMQSERDGSQVKLYGACRLLCIEHCAPLEGVT